MDLTIRMDAVAATAGRYHDVRTLSDHAPGMSLGPHRRRVALSRDPQRRGEAGPAPGSVRGAEPALHGDRPSAGRCALRDCPRTKHVGNRVRGQSPEGLVRTGQWSRFPGLGFGVRSQPLEHQERGLAELDARGKPLRELDRTAHEERWERDVVRRQHRDRWGADGRAEPGVGRLERPRYTEVELGKSRWVTYSSTRYPVAAAPFGLARTSV